MPPSPVLRCSPARELRGAKHKRGHSIENGLLFKEKDDHLALFNEMQDRERKGFLLQSSDDFEDAFYTKLKDFSDFNLGITIPVQRERSELLNADGDKNDYDWLLTPPDTPLFPSLDDETPPVTDTHRGRPRGQSISLSRSSTMERSHRSNRSSASPNRLSSSPRPGSSTTQLRGRPSSSRHSSPTPSLRPSTPARGLSPSPSKPSTPASRSSTPTSRRMSTGSSTMAVSGVRGTSPVRKSRGNSSSPKIRAWQSNIPGFSLDAPPNLRTSLADRYVRGSSPASRNGRDSTSRHSRQSMSPVASRSVSSSHSHDRDQFTSHTKGSVASSGDDDLDSLQYLPLGDSDRSASKTIGPFSNNRAPRSSKILSPGSAPKRSFDSALHQLDRRKNHQNMFRPLMSSVPSSSFNAGKGSYSHHHIISSHSSMTTSSNAGFEQGTGVAPDAPVSNSRQVDPAESQKLPYPDEQEDMFDDKVDASTKFDEHEKHDSALNNQLGDRVQDSIVKCEPDLDEEFRHHVVVRDMSVTSDCLHQRSELPEVVGLENMEICFNCGHQYQVIEPVEGEVKLCPDCRQQHDLVNVTVFQRATPVLNNFSDLSVKISEETKSFDEINSPIHMPELLEQIKSNVKENAVATTHAEVDDERIKYQHDIEQPSIGHSLPDRGFGGQELQLSSDHQELKVDSSEGGGIAMLLKRSSSIKEPVSPDRNFAATIRPRQDFSSARESTNSFRSSTGHSSASASSSVDYGSTRHKETRVQRQLSGKTLDGENYKYDMSSKSPSSVSSLSEVSSHAQQSLGVATATSEENVQVPNAHLISTNEGAPQDSQFEIQILENKEDDYKSKSFANVTMSEENTRSTEISTSDLSSNIVSIPLEDKSFASLQDDENCGSSNEEDLLNHASSIPELEASSIAAVYSVEENHCMLITRVDGEDVVEIPGHSSLVTTSEIETESCEHEIPCLENDDRYPKSKFNINGFQEASDTCSSDKKTSVLEANSDLATVNTKVDGEEDDMEILGLSSLVTTSKLKTESCEHEIPCSQDDDESPKSKYSTNEFQEPPSTGTSGKAMTTSVLEANSSDHSRGILDDSTVLIECHEGNESRSLTLEEAMDTILFCSSIVHDLVYQAASTAIEKTNDVPWEVSLPTVTVLRKSNADKKDPRDRKKPKHTSTPVKGRQRRQTDTDVKPPPSKTVNDENAGEPMVHTVVISNKGESFKPPKLDPKCNCTIM